jgi:hypothetical protein
MYKAGFLASSFDSWRAGWAAGSIPVREPIPGLDLLQVSLSLSYSIGPL